MTMRLTQAVKALAVACLGLFLIQQTVDQFLGGNLLSWLGLIPEGVVFQFRIWQLFTYSFLHADVLHLFLNLLMLVFIGSELEAAWGTVRFLRYYFVCVISAGLLYLLLQVFVWRGLNVPMVGASGGVYGLLMAYGLIFGERVLLFMMLFPMKAKHFVWVLAGVEFMTTVFSGRAGGGLSSAAHLGGMIAGLVYLWGGAAYRVSKKRKGSGGGPGPGRLKRNPKHLRLVVDNPEDQKPGKRKGSPGGRDDLGDGPKTWH